MQVTYRKEHGNKIRYPISIITVKVCYKYLNKNKSKFFSKIDKDKSDKLETWIYEINYKEEDCSEGKYIGLTKRKNIKIIQKHKSDIKYRKNTIAWTKFNNNENLEIDFDLKMGEGGGVKKPTGLLY